MKVRHGRFLFYLFFKFGCLMGCTSTLQKNDSVSPSLISSADSSNPTPLSTPLSTPPLKVSQFWLRFNPCKCSNIKDDLEISKDKRVWERVHWLNTYESEANGLKKFWYRFPYEILQASIDFTSVRVERTKGHWLRQIKINFEQLKPSLYVREEINR